MKGILPVEICTRYGIVSCAKIKDTKVDEARKYGYNFSCIKPFKFILYIDCKGAIEEIYSAFAICMLRN